ncbi:MAG: ferredoxin [Myxococcota bacterium]|jgi:ferredoxin
MAEEKRRGWLRTGLKRAASRLTARTPVIPAGPFSLEFEGSAPIPVPGGTTILAGAGVAGVDLDHYCGGMASCGTCKVTVVTGAENLMDADGREQMVLGSQSTAAGHRLACQARVVGPVTVRIPRWF